MKFVTHIRPQDEWRSDKIFLKRCIYGFLIDPLLYLISHMSFVKSSPKWEKAVLRATGFSYEKLTKSIFDRHKKEKNRITTF